MNQLIANTTGLQFDSIMYKYPSLAAQNRISSEVSAVGKFSLTIKVRKAFGPIGSHTNRSPTTHTIDTGTLNKWIRNEHVLFRFSEIFQTLQTANANTNNKINKRICVRPVFVWYSKKWKRDFAGGEKKKMPVNSTRNCRKRLAGTDFADFFFLAFSAVLKLSKQSWFGRGYYNAQNFPALTGLKIISESFISPSYLAVRCACRRKTVWLCSSTLEGTFLLWAFLLFSPRQAANCKFFGRTAPQVQKEG